MLTLARKMRRADYRLLHLAVPKVRTPGYFSQHGQDRFIAETLLAGKRNGVFVDVGAYDGETFSNTLHMERVLGWTGLAIEPQPRAFQLLQTRRTCATANCCVADYTGDVEFLDLEGYAAMFSGMQENYDANHKARIRRDLRLHGGDQHTIRVPCVPLMSLLLKHGLHDIDYMSIDTEGSEYAILSSIDFAAIAIDVISVENNYGDRKFERLMRGAGYRMVALAGPDEIYVSLKSGAATRTRFLSN